MKYNTRIAPSNSGFPHMGNFRTAYLNWLAARSSGGTFTLRIDDTDLSRSDPKYTQVILDTMDWLGLDYDKHFKQSDRFDIYRNAVQTLIAKGVAKNDGTAIILYPQVVPDFWEDAISKIIQITQDDKNIISRGIVLIKSDGSPTYHFASVVDDIQYNINYVIRGVDHITNTAKQIAIYIALGAAHCIPKFAHVGLIHKDGKKLSKRDNAASMLWYKDQGYDPDAILNFMIRMGWGPTTDDKATSLLPKDRMMQLFFDGGHMRNSAANMDLAKLDSFDRKYKARK